MTSDDNQIIFEVDFKQILQGTAIAFPTVILMRKYLPFIKYQIRSKFVHEVLSGLMP